MPLINRCGGGGEPTLQNKSASPRTYSQSITPDSGYDGLSKVSISAMSMQSKDVTPSDEPQTIYPSSGYDGLSSVMVGAGGRFGSLSNCVVWYQNEDVSYGLDGQEITQCTKKISITSINTADMIGCIIFPQGDLAASEVNYPNYVITAIFIDFIKSETILFSFSPGAKAAWGGFTDVTSVNYTTSSITIDISNTYLLLPSIVSTWKVIPILNG